MTNDLRTLLDMLTYCRPADDAMTQIFVDRFLTPIPGAEQDTSGNVIVTRGPADLAARTLFSAHTDTVHRQGGRQRLHYDAVAGTVQLAKHARRRSSCLGADDTAGVWILTQMIAADVPGTYVFHAGEEIGGVGSVDLAETRGPWLRGFARAIAFDRRGTSDVITHQGGRTASDAFGRALADGLNAIIPTFTYAPSDRGLFTDTANYDRLIAECTNLSIGYESAHTSREWLDLGHLLRLRDAAVRLDWDNLPTDRDPLGNPWTDLPDDPDDADVPCWHCDHAAWLHDESTGRCYVCTSGECPGYDTTFEDPEDDTRLYLDRAWADIRRALRRIH